MSIYTAFTHLPLARRHRIAQDIVAFSKGVLPLHDWPAMFQDILEAKALPELPYQFTTAAQHMVDQRLCTYSGHWIQ